MLERNAQQEETTLETLTSETGLPIQVVCDEDGASRLILTGVIDVYLADDLRRCALDLLRLRRDVLVDLTGVDSMDVSGMQVLLALRSDLESRGGKLAVAGASANASRCFRIAGIAGILNSE